MTSKKTKKKFRDLPPGMSIVEALATGKMTQEEFDIQSEIMSRDSCDYDKSELQGSAKFIMDVEAKYNLNKNMTYKVFIDDNFHFTDESERVEHGQFATIEEAVDACREIVNSSLASSYKPGMNSHELFNHYVSFGDDPWISSEDKSEKIDFKARNYARIRCGEICSKK